MSARFQFSLPKFKLKTHQWRIVFAISCTVLLFVIFMNKSQKRMTDTDEFVIAVSSRDNSTSPFDLGQEGSRDPTCDQGSGRHHRPTGPGTRALRCSRAGSRMSNNPGPDHGIDHGSYPGQSVSGWGNPGMQGSGDCLLYTSPSPRDS